jgi:hypothetical protein
MAIDATRAITDLVEAMHGNISPLEPPAPDGQTADRRTGGLTGLVYSTVRGATSAIGSGIDLVLGQLAPLIAERVAATSPTQALAATPIPAREAVIAALNGVMGDYLHATGNPLAITMALRRDGVPIALERAAIAKAVPDAGPRVLLMLHGLCMNDLQWVREGADFGAALAHEYGWTPLTLHYNTGLHVSDNGLRLAHLLEDLLAQWPVAVEELAILGHSMGGLVARSAVRQAQGNGVPGAHTWPSRLSRMVFLGTPHHGAPLERGGHRLDALFALTPYTAPFTRLGRLRSAGITDLRFGSLLASDWVVPASGRSATGRTADPRQPVPLPAGVTCYAAAALIAEESDSARAHLVGDGLVPLDSALGRHPNPRMALAFDPANCWIGRGLRHLELQTAPQVLEQALRWLP